jgi:type I restriction enzyme S subunit
MKEGWEYKKLGEVCNIYQPKTLSSKELVEDGKYLVYGANGVIGK